MIKNILYIQVILFVSTSSFAGSLPMPSSWNWSLSSPRNNSISNDTTPALKAKNISEAKGITVQLYEDSYCSQPIGAPSAVFENEVNISDVVFSADGSDDGIKSFWAIATNSNGAASSCSFINRGYFLRTY